MPVTRSALYLDGISVSFDGFKALNNLSVELAAGELRAVIGPNGAGKSTMMDVITGKTRPDQGTALFLGRHDLTLLDETQIANLGIGRKFQKPSVIETLTVWENLELALAGNRSPWRSILQILHPQDRRSMTEVASRVGLADALDQLGGALSHGQKQWLEIGMLLLQEPKVLLVDEPAAGMTDAETLKTAELLKSLAGEHTVMVVEHDMEFVEALGCKVTVLHEGHVLAEGSLSHVSSNNEVIDVYLGR
ncbi:MAG: urea ABC transporter ATP-binding protein UrtD [Litoricola sp.]|nr:urea ABC transporter ATP-binding protein UrtD [Litorivicinus sp.]MBL6809591.1 urea ABC transporter ATP-binding protein UrtD [Litorivicinus sp.]MDA0894199.1 urea ABC transporter ATP-binding protein UrtD [Pseudomonadota bacterium]HAB68503.1 urea ABC transporter ATP-binding protein UrtD [Gammaproteobacteria bacterium]